MMGFAMLSALFEDRLRALRRSGSHIKNVQVATRDFARYCQEQNLHDARELEARHLAGYVRDLQARSLKPSTIYARQRLLRTWTAWLTLQGQLLLDPFKSFHCKHPPHLPRGAPSESRVLAFLHAPPTDTAPGRRDRALFEFLYGTGLRVGEMQWVEIGHLDFQTMQLRVDRGKAQLSRILPIGPHLAAVLQDYLANTRPVLARKDHQALFLNNIGQRLVAGLAMTYVRNYAKSLGFSGFSAHMFRHAFATHLLQRGAPIVAVQRLLGHVTLTMTTRYVHLVAADLQDELRRTHPRAKRRKRRPIRH